MIERVTNKVDVSHHKTEIMSENLIQKDNEIFKLQADLRNKEEDWKRKYTSLEREKQMLEQKNRTPERNFSATR